MRPIRPGARVTAGIGQMCMTPISQRPEGVSPATHSAAIRRLALGGSGALQGVDLVEGGAEVVPLEFKVVAGPQVEYERLYREPIDDALDLVREADAFRVEFNTIRPSRAPCREPPPGAPHWPRRPDDPQLSRARATGPQRQATERSHVWHLRGARPGGAPAAAVVPGMQTLTEPGPTLRAGGGSR